MARVQINLFINNLKFKIMETKKELISALRVLNNVKTRSKWEEGVKTYANMLIDNYEEYVQYNNELEFCEKTLLNGVENWKQYAYGAGGFVYSSVIAETLCTPSELKRTKNGMLPPNKSESWIDVEARALYQAWLRLNRFFKVLDVFRK